MKHIAKGSNVSCICRSTTSRNLATKVFVRLYKKKNNQMEGCPVVQTKSGKVKGKIIRAVDSLAKVVFTYLGIPYGKPPVGKLRFVAPEKAEFWEGVLKAVHTFKNCPQNDEAALRLDKICPFKNELGHDRLSSDEDCLKLNVFTPECNEHANKAVMVWLSGGAYQRHYGGRRNGSALAGMNDCVIVVPNFRTNIFGYFSLGKGTCCPGNAALLDVILALKWVQDNISVFGGDPNNVTIFGESSGSGMVHILMMSSLSRGLFHKAIMQSGSALSPFLLKNDLCEQRDAFLSRFNLDIKTMEDGQIMEKLQGIPANEIKALLKDFEGTNAFIATVDGHVITDTPDNLVKAGHVHHVPLIIGCTDGECLGLLSMMALPQYAKGLTEEMAKTIFSLQYNKTYKTDKGEMMYNLAKTTYLEDESDPLAYSKFYGDMSGDTVFVVPSILTAAAHVAAGLPTFFYVMTQRPEFNHSAINGPEVEKRPEFSGCDHADDLHFVWGEPFEEGELSGGAYFTDEETEFSRLVMKYFVNFAKTGNPNQPEQVSIKWPAYSMESERPHIVLQMPLKTDVNFGLDKVELLTKVFPQQIAAKK